MRKKFSIFFVILTFFFISSYNPRSSKNKFINIFQIKKIEIKNNKILSKDDILNEIKPIFGRSLFLFNSDELFDLISRVDFVDSAEIKKIYPSTLKITIKEKNPVAILLIDKKKYLVSSSGEQINFIENNKFNDLPVIFGADIKKFQVLYKTLESINFNIDEINSFYFFKIGRWDIKLNSGVLIRLPQNKYRESLENFIKVNSEIKNKYKIFDYRIENQLILN